MRVYLHSSAVVGSQICEIPLNSERIRSYNKSRSSKVIDLAVSRKRVCDLLLVIISKFVRICCGFLRFKVHTSLVLTPRFRGNPLEFRDEIYPAKTRGMGLPYGENFIIVPLTVFD